MTKEEAVKKIAREGYISIEHAEELYDEIIPKPVVPQYVADWYEGNCGDLSGALFTMTRLWDEKSRNSDFYRWFRKDKEAFQTLVNMHQFGYEVEKDKKYIVKFKNFRTNASYLKQDLAYQEYYLGGTHVNKSIILEHTREELELNGLGWVFDCEGVEATEVTNE